MLRRAMRNSDASTRALDEIRAGTANQSDILNRKLGEVIGETANLSNILNQKLDEIVAGTANQSDILNRKLDEVIGETANLSNILNQKLDEVVAGTANQSDILNRKLIEVIAGTSNQSDILNRKLNRIIAIQDRRAAATGKPVYANRRSVDASPLEGPGGLDVPETAGHQPIEVWPTARIPYPVVDLAALRNPLPAILDAPELTVAEEYFLRNPAAARALVSSKSHALLYSLIRNLSPAHVFEIGTYKAASTEAICRALHANGHGTLYTTDPFPPEDVPEILDQWPAELRQHARFLDLESMPFFSEMAKAGGISPDLVFVDGQHDYEYAAFDIACSARVLRPGGFIVVDNVSQAGPFFAARDFLDQNQEWTECCGIDRAPDPSKAFDAERSNIPGTDFMVLRAPASLSVGTRPSTFGEVSIPATKFDGVVVSLGQPVDAGTLYVQCVLRGFSDNKEPCELSKSASQILSSDDAGTKVTLPIPMDAGAGYTRARLETWLTWTGARPLLLVEPPSALLDA